MITDLERYEVHTKFDRAVPLVYRFTNEELPEPENLGPLRQVALQLNYATS